eukprot:811-Heterococcus_DN1.PRE.2
MYIQRENVKASSVRAQYDRQLVANSCSSHRTVLYNSSSNSNNSSTSRTHLTAQSALKPLQCSRRTSVWPIYTALHYRGNYRVRRVNSNMAAADLYTTKAALLLLPSTQYCGSISRDSGSSANVVKWPVRRSKHASTEWVQSGTTSEEIVDGGQHANATVKRRQAAYSVLRTALLTVLPNAY